MNRAELELSILDEISRVLGSTLELRRIFDQIMNILASRLEMRRGSLVMMDDGTKPLNIESAHGLTNSEKGFDRFDEGIIAKAMEQGSPIVVPDIRKDSRFLNRTGARVRDRHEVISFICIPIRIESRVVGALIVDKPFADNETLNRDRRLLTIIASIIAQAIKFNQMVTMETQSLKEQNIQLRQELKAQYQLHNIVGVSSAMQEVIETTARVAKSKATVLIQGETGTGKTHIARTIHYNSDRADMPFVRLYCGTLSERLLERELFGYVKGALPGAAKDKMGVFEIADKGTLFLDAVSEMSPNLQGELLRVLEEKKVRRIGGAEPIPVDVRLIAASNKNLEDLIKCGLFREDLYYRLHVVPIYLPPLRERREDIPLLVSHLLDKHSRQNNKCMNKIEPKAMSLLLQYPWPGNVRELENYIERAVAQGAGEILTVKMLPANVRSYQSPIMRETSDSVPLLDQLFGTHVAPQPKRIPADTIDLLPRMEKILIERVLKLTHNGLTEAARILGIHRNTLRNKMKRYGIGQKANTL